MLPILYGTDATNNELLNTNGLGFLKKCTRCEVTKEHNGVYEIELDIKPDDRLAKEVVLSGYVKAKPTGVENPQIFRIYEVTSTNSLIQVRGEHIRYKLSDNLILENYQVTGTPEYVWGYIQDTLIDEHHGFTFTSNITTSGTVTAAKNSPIKLGEFMMGADGSMLDVFGGTYEYDNFSIALNAQSDVVSGVCLRLGAGMDSIDYSMSCENQYTHIMPVASVTTPNGGSWYVNFPQTYERDVPLVIRHTTDDKKRVLLRDFTEEFKQAHPTFVCDPTDQSSREYAQEWLWWLGEHYKSLHLEELGFPRVNVKVTTRAGTERLKDLKVGDNIRVYHEKLNLTLTLRIIKTVYDSIGERYISVELGKPKRKISKYFSNKNIGGI